MLHNYLQDIKKYTAPTHPDFEFLTLAIERLSKMLQSHNSGIDPKAAQYAQKLLAIAYSIENVGDIPVTHTQGVSITIILLFFLEYY